MTPRLTAEQLRRRCETTHFAFATTADAPELEGIIGQARTTRAIEFGIEMPYPGYNIFAMGPGGAGKTSTLTGFLEDRAATRPVPADWGYIHNFKDPIARRPSGCRPAGEANCAIRWTRCSWVSPMHCPRRSPATSMPSIATRSRASCLTSGMNACANWTPPREAGLRADQRPPAWASPGPRRPTDDAGAVRCAVGRGKRGDQRARPGAAGGVGAHSPSGARDRGAAHDRLANLDQEIAAATIRPPFEPLAAEYAAWPDVLAYLVDVQTHIAQHADNFKVKLSAAGQGEQAEDGAAAGEAAPLWLQPDPGTPLDQYHLNVIVDNRDLSGAPVIVETNPTYANLVGRVEMRAQFGTLVSDYRHVKAGALHRANGGYLVLDPRVLLRQPLAWEALKQALRNRRIRIEEGFQTGVLVAATLTPEPMRRCEVVLIGDPATYYTLYAYDEQFEKLFKVRADFAVEMGWTSENEARIAQFIRNRVEDEGLLHFDIGAVGKVVEYAARLVEDQRKLTTRLAHVNDIVREASFWAVVRAAGRIRGCGAGYQRTDLPLQPIRGASARGDHRRLDHGGRGGRGGGPGERAGRDRAGRLRVWPADAHHRADVPGPGGVINIEREARMSGRTHDKGMLILSVSWGRLLRTGR